MIDLAFGFEKPEDSPGFLLWQVSTIWQRTIRKALLEFEINHPQFVIMALLLWLDGNKIATNQSNIAKYSKLDKMTISTSLSVLSEKLFIEREISDEDTRSKIIKLTVDGKRFITKIVPIIEKIDEEFFLNINEDEPHISLKVRLNKIDG